MRVEVSAVGLPLGRKGLEHEVLAQDCGSRIQVDVREGSKVADLVRWLRLEGEVQQVLVNGDDAGEATVLKDGDAVALVGQVSGL